jgi:hypothetical protein
MNKTTKIIIGIVALLAIIAAVVIGIVTTSGSSTPAPIKTPVAVETTTPAPTETAVPDPTEGDEVTGFDEYNAKFTESHTFAAGESTVATAGEIAKDCGAEPVAFEGAVLNGYIVTYSDEAHTTAIDIACSFTASTEDFEDAGFEGLE